MNEEMVYHVKWGEGSIVNYYENKCIINFKNVGNKTFENTAFGIYLFRKDNDMMQAIENDKYRKQTCIDSRYKSYKVAKIKDEMKNVNTAIPNNLDKTQLINIELNNRNYVLGNILHQSIRNIVLVLNQVIKFKDKKYLELIGIDVYTGNVVKIVDTNGMKVGYHTFDKKIASIPRYTVIQSEFRNFENSNELNVIRIKDSIKILGKSDLIKLMKKYDYILMNYNVGFHSFITSFDKVMEIYEASINKKFYAIVKFNNCLIKKYKDVYQLKLKNNFVNISNPNSAIIAQLPYFTGYSLITVMCLAERPQITSNILIGQYFNEEESQKIKRHKAELNEHNKEYIHEYEYEKEAMYQGEDTDEYEIMQMYEDEYYELEEEAERNGDNDPFKQCDDSYFYDVDNEY